MNQKQISRGSGRVRAPIKIAAFTLCALVTALFLFRLTQDGAGPRPTSTTDSAPVSSTDVSAEPAVAERPFATAQPRTAAPLADPVASARPLPAPEVPFREQLPQLQQRASIGDPVAACRLALGVNRCAGYLGRKRFVEQAFGSLDRMSAAGNTEFAVEALARAQESVRIAERFCSGVDVAGLPDADPGLNAALASLSPHQKTMLAMMLADGQIRRIQTRPWSSQAADYIVPQFIADNTVRFLHDGFAARQPLAIEGLILLHSPSSMVAAQGVMTRQPDRRKFAAYALLYRRLYGPQAMGPRVNQILDAVLATMPPGDVDVLRSDVEREAQQWVEAAGSSGLTADQVLPPIPDIDDPVAECDR
jgi:hypothetical protein